MKLLITRPAVLAGAGGTRSFVPGLTVEVDAQTAQQILERQAGIAADLVAQPDTPTAPRRKKAADDQI